MLNINDETENDSDENEITKSNRSLFPDSSSGSDEDVISIPEDSEAAVDIDSTEIQE